MSAHYHDADPTPITGGWACWCEHPETPERPADWQEIRSRATTYRHRCSPATCGREEDASVSKPEIKPTRATRRVLLVLLTGASNLGGGDSRRGSDQAACT